MTPDYGKLTIVGCGPGGREYLTGQALAAVEKADLLCGPRFLLDLFPGVTAERIVVRANAQEVVALVHPRLERQRVVLLVTGDPGLHSLAAPVARLLGRDRVRLIPGISSVQLAFARLALPWEQARIFSLHGVPDERARIVLGELAVTPTAVVLCSPQWTSGRVLASIVDRAGHRTAHVLSDLGRPTESRISGQVAELARRGQGSGRSLVILTEEWG
jgi:precorrin-6y C5,15-methyltransferase (decarboxylating) CbiE subunit